MTFANINEGRANEGLTVGELIEQLSEINSNVRVLIEGCDCEGYVRSVEMVDDFIKGTRIEEVLIRRI